MANEDGEKSPRSADPEARTLVAKHKAFAADSTPRKVDVHPAAVPASGAELGGRYAESHMLGEGAMGTVALVRDTRIGRDVAVKRMHAAHREGRPDLRDRFLREARVQGQLEHPSVVPVYDIGADDFGGPYFSMKRVRGRTLAEVVEGLKRNDPDIAHAYSRRRLLTAMSRVCLCVSFAHERGVVHRDLKPSNIMLGDYGEVHVLDWGIAQVAGADDFEGGTLNLEGDRVHRTQSGFVIGTPGYMAPEQARGERDTYGGRADVYALGAMLFEVMTLRKLHEADSIETLLLSTVSGVEARPSVRAKERNLPEELDTICARATALNPDNRYPSARAMNDAIEAVLDGDRDSSRRAELSAQHMEVAREALLWAREGGARANGQHRRAVGALLHALSLEPDHQEARAALVGLLLEPNDALPTEALVEHAEVKLRDRVRAARMNVAGLVGWWPVIPLAAWMGLRQTSMLWALAVVTIGLLVYFSWMAVTDRVGRRHTIPALFAGFLVISSMSMFFGPLFVVPGMAVGAAAASMVGLRVEREGRILINALAQASFLVPALLQWTGAIKSSYVFSAGQLCIQPGVTELPEGPTWAFLIVTNMLTIAMGSILTGRAVEALLAAERHTFAQAWRLRQFLPEMHAPERSAAQVSET